MIALRPTRLHWIKDHPDDPHDLCAHSPVDFRVGNTALVRPEDGDWAVGVAALHLLRALSENHDREHLFPHCGQWMYLVDGLVTNGGCQSGVEIGIARAGSTVLLTPAQGPALEVSFRDFVRAVIEFSDEVAAFYARSSPKNLADPVDAEWFSAFMSEWHERRAASEKLMAEG
jgi:hypothetical protein